MLSLTKRLCVVGVCQHMMSANRRRTFTVFVEGNIGSGKTTFLKHFESQDNVAVVPEPVNDWQSIGGLNLLNLFYEDPEKWGMTFQSYVQLSMMKRHLHCVDKPVKILERSLYSARYCFIENLVKNEIMTKAELIVLDEWFKWITTNLDVCGDLIVYLRTSPEVVYERIKKRGRKEEAHISLEYLTALHNLHEDWLIHGNKHKAHVPVLVVDGSKALSHMKSEYLNCEYRIMENVSACIGLL